MSARAVSFDLPARADVSPETVERVQALVVRCQAIAGRAVRAAEVKAWARREELAQLPLVSTATISVGRLLARCKGLAHEGQVLQCVGHTGGYASWRVVKGQA